LELTSEGESDVGWEGVVFFAEGQEEGSVLENIQGRAEVPERRHDEGDLAGDASELFKKSDRILDVFDRVRAEGVLELAGGKRKVVDIIHDYEVGDIGVFDDIDINAAPIGFPAADVEVPDGAPPADDPAHDAVTELVESGKNEE